MSASDVTFRPATSDDTAFIMSSWLASWRKSPWAGIILNNDYYPYQRKVIESLVLRGAQFEVACAAARPDRILGWCCYETAPDGSAVAHVVYTKDPYLKLGINEALLARIPGNRPGLYTHRTRQTEAASRASSFIHAPEVARRR